MTLHKVELKSEAVFFDGLRANAIEIRDWIEESNGRVAVTSYGDEANIDILSKKGAWFLVCRPGWIVRDPAGNFSHYTPKDFRLKFGHEAIPMNLVTDG